MTVCIWLSRWYISGAFVQTTSSKDVNQDATLARKTINQLKSNRKSNEPCQICAAYFSTENELKNRRENRSSLKANLYWRHTHLFQAVRVVGGKRSSSSSTDYFFVVALARNPIDIVTFVTEAAPCPRTLLFIICLLNKTLLLETLSTTSATETSIPLVMNSFSR